MKIPKAWLAAALAVFSVGILAGCVTVIDRRPPEVERHQPPKPEKRQPPRGPEYRAGQNVVVTGVVQPRGSNFILNDDASDAEFLFMNLRFDEKAALQRQVGRHARIQLVIKSQQGPRGFLADFLRVMP
jgi:hypothetical protein